MSTTTDVPPARRGRPGYDRDGMLEVIVAAFNDHGYDATSLGIIAQRLGLSKSAVYHHFASKEEMLELALEKALGELQAVFEAPEANEGPVDLRIRFVLRGAVTVACEQLPYLTLLLRLRGNTDVQRRAMERRRELDHRLRRLFELAREEGSLRDDMDPGVAERLTFGLVNSIVEWYRPDGPMNPDQLADAVVAFVRSGLRVSETRDFR
ncbi:TetR family transcriptional regulator [Microbacterium sp. MEC084]|uniref:TetR/AcrR family transcriptional regulator n=1 Tax=unclassified Microbacterium TaxID=2609290 RepID=UPI0006F4A610|nr:MULTISPECIES: TetR/AcrR family transcriptional regulator [unclassified Microbacterium]KQY99210.1 TetR family transcriptional regulator [Microbacterium sp. Root53]MCD1269146.1 TetR family transcriptional regulator [Microbacterium sp. MEC084]